MLSWDCRWPLSDSGGSLAAAAWGGVSSRAVAAMVSGAAGRGPLQWPALLQRERARTRRRGLLARRHAAAVGGPGHGARQQLASVLHAASSSQLRQKTHRRLAALSLAANLLADARRNQASTIAASHQSSSKPIAALTPKHNGRLRQHRRPSKTGQPHAPPDARLPQD